MAGIPAIHVIRLHFSRNLEIVTPYSEPPIHPMHNLYAEAKYCFLLKDPDEKLTHGLEVCSAWEAGRLEWQAGEKPEGLMQPGHLSIPQLVPPREVPRRGFGNETNRAALIHALAHIELTAVNLAWDSIYRYRGLPRAYYEDWIKAAKDETSHFLALRERLRSMGFDYGHFSAHDELWGSAVRTAGDLMDRMAIVHRVMEARALDTVPGIQRKFSDIGDRKTAAVLLQIANDEVGHVQAGTRWFHYRCEQEGLEPDETFFHLIQQYGYSYPKAPFNREARLQAGFSPNEMALLEDYAR